MTQEEKTKRYDRAVKVIKENLDALNEITETGAEIVNIQTVKSCFYRAFPELKESGDDERIRKALIKIFKHKNQSFIDELTNYSGNIKIEEVLSWLEKQGEKKELKDIEQNLAWSEEDEKILNEIFSVAARASLRKSTLFGKSYDYIKWQDWLKSFKDRVQPQPKQEWSEEDEKIGKELIDFCIKCSQGSTVVNSQNDFTRWTTWLKSLKPQNKWKPTEEQMKVLMSEVEGWMKGCPKQKVLESLYQDLKKLKE